MTTVRLDKEAALAGHFLLRHPRPEELRRLTARPEATADLAAIRARREQLTLEISQTEKALEEAEGTLAAGGGLAAFAAAG